MASSVSLITRTRPRHVRAPRGRGDAFIMEGCWSAQPDAAPAGGNLEVISTRVFFGLCCGASSRTSRHFAGGDSASVFGFSGIYFFLSAFMLVSDSITLLSLWRLFLRLSWRYLNP